MELRHYGSPEALAQASADFIAERARRAIEARGEFVVALSGGPTPIPTWQRLRHADLAWEAVTIYQVDERVAPEGDPARNLTGLGQGLSPRRPRIVAMPVQEEDLEAAAAHYADLLPARFDLVQLGLGPDGHTASLVAGDPVLDVRDRLVAVTAPYRGWRRMTMTYPALARAEETLWIIASEESRDALASLVAGDGSIPAGRVASEHAVVLTDLAEAGVAERRQG